MQTTLIAAPAFVAFVAGLFSLGGADPSAQAAAIAALQSPAVASAAAEPALFRVRGEWVAGGTRKKRGSSASTLCRAMFPPRSAEKQGLVPLPPPPVSGGGFHFSGPRRCRARRPRRRRSAPAAAAIFPSLSPA